MSKPFFACAIAAAVLSMSVSGCNSEKPKKWVEDPNPPLFGSSAKLNTIPGFLEGKWGLKSVVDKSIPKDEYKLGEVSKQVDEAGVGAIITFAADGTYKLRFKDYGYPLAGTYAMNGDKLYLTWTTHNGKPLQAELDQIKKDEEQGGQVSILRAERIGQVQARMTRISEWTLAKDRKHLTVPDANDPFRMMMGDNALVRMMEDKSEG